jgi:hypothetical protein
MMQSVRGTTSVLHRFVKRRLNANSLIISILMKVLAAQGEQAV